jgi:ATP-dependent Lon protease
MKKIIMEVLQTITQNKKDAKQFPDFVIETELRKEITERTKEALRELWRERKINVGRTINHNYIELITDPKQARKQSIIHKTD